MLSGFSSYFFGGNAEDQQQMSQDDSLTASAENSDWVFVENPGKQKHDIVSFIVLMYLDYCKIQ